MLGRALPGRHLQLVTSGMANSPSPAGPSTGQRLVDSRCSNTVPCLAGILGSRCWRWAATGTGYGTRRTTPRTTLLSRPARQTAASTCTTPPTWLPWRDPRQRCRPRMLQGWSPPLPVLPRRVRALRPLASLRGAPPPRVRPRPRTRQLPGPCCPLGGLMEGLWERAAPHDNPPLVSRSKALCCAR